MATTTACTEVPPLFTSEQQAWIEKLVTRMTTTTGTPPAELTAAIEQPTDDAAVLLAEVTKKAASYLSGEAVVVEHQNGFYYNLQVGGYWNDNSLKEVDLRPQLFKSHITFDPPCNLTDSYVDVLKNIQYRPSKAVEQQRQRETSLASAQLNTVITDWETAFRGPITDEQISNFTPPLFPPNKETYIRANVLARWPNPNDIDPAFQPFKDDYLRWIDMTPLNTQYNLQRADAQSHLTDLITNTTKPSAKNGGLLGLTPGMYFPAYKLPSMQEIVNSLNNSKEEITIKANADHLDVNQVSGSVSGGASFKVPVLSWLGLGGSGSASYDWVKETTDQSSMELTVTWSGVTKIGSSPGVFSRGLGWFDVDVLRDAHERLTADKTGYTLVGDRYDSKVFETGGPLTYLSQWLISKKPVVSMKFHHFNSHYFEEHFAVKAKVQLSLFGIFKFGASSSYSVNNYKYDSNEQTIEITCGPDDEILTVPEALRSACIIAGVPVSMCSNPDNSSSSSSVRMDSSSFMWPSTVSEFVSRLPGFYQLLKVFQGPLYCSSTQFHNSEQGEAWVAALMQAEHISERIVLETSTKTYLPANALMWPTEQMSTRAAQLRTSYPCYQAAALQNGISYCSRKKVHSHDEGANWVTTLIKAKNSSAAGKPWLLDSQKYYTDDPNSSKQLFP